MEQANSQAKVIARTFGINTVALRFGNVYGPGSENKLSVVAKFIKQVLSQETLEIYGDGSQTRDFIYIDDLIDAIILSSIKKGIGGETFQIANNSETTINEIIRIIVKEFNKRGFKNISLKNVETRLGDVERNYSDTQKAYSFLGWKPKVKLEQGISNTITYFINKK